MPAVEHDALRPSRYEKPVSRPQPFFGVTGRGMGRARAARQSARGTWSRAARTTTSTDSIALHNDSNTDGGGGGAGDGAKSAHSAFILCCCGSAGKSFQTFLIFFFALLHDVFLPPLLLCPVLTACEA